jgi:hypothetical protein
MKVFLLEMFNSVHCQCPEEKFMKVIFLKLVQFQKEQYSMLDRLFVTLAHTYKYNVERC